MPMDPNTPISEQTGGLMVQRAVGAVTLAVGVALGAMLLLGLVKAVTQVQPVATPALVFMVVLAALAAFFLSTGWRMAFNRPNRYGSVLTPSLWFFAAGLFLCCAGFIAVHLVRSGGVDRWEVPVYAVLFAVLSVLAGRRTRRKVRLR